LHMYHSEQVRNIAWNESQALAAVIRTSLHLADTICVRFNLTDVHLSAEVWSACDSPAWWPRSVCSGTLGAFKDGNQFGKRTCRIATRYRSDACHKSIPGALRSPSSRFTVTDSGLKKGTLANQAQ